MQEVVIELSVPNLTNEMKVQKMNDKYVKLADVKRKLRYIFKAYGVGSFVREKVERALNNLPYSIKGDLETTLETADVQPVNQWISVNDRLPEAVEEDVNGKIAFSELVLVYLVYNNGFTYITTDQCRVDDKSWLHEIPGEGCKVTHWQPLPEPPKDGDVDNNTRNLTDEETDIYNSWLEAEAETIDEISLL